MAAMRRNVVLGDELYEIVKADAALILAFALTMTGGVFGLLSGSGGGLSTLVYLLPVVALGVTLSFVLHELMHKFVAQRYGAIAGFQSSNTGLAITLVTGAFGFLLGIPGATVIYASNFTREENGIVSLAGPLTNFAVFAVFLLAQVAIGPAQGSYAYYAISFTMFISLLLAFFNMLPMYPLDGSKVLAWNGYVYGSVMVVLLGLIWWLGVLPIGSLVYMLVIAVLLSSLFRHIF